MKITFLFSFFISISMGFLYFEDWVFLFSKIPPFSVCIKTIFEKGNEMNENKKSDEHLLNFLSLFLVVSLFCCFFFFCLWLLKIFVIQCFLYLKKNPYIRFLGGLIAKWDTIFSLLFSVSVSCCRFCLVSALFAMFVGCVRSQRRRKFPLWCKVTDEPRDEGRAMRTRMSGAHGSLYGFILPKMFNHFGPLGLY